MGEAGPLLLLLSSTDRRRLLEALAKEGLRASQLACRLSMTVQETARQITKLQEAGLIERDAHARFRLTGLGELALRFFPAVDFLARHSAFAGSHDLASLPREFVARIGELGQGEFADTLGAVLGHFEEVVSASREYVWLMADQVLLQDVVTERVLAADSVTWRIIMPAVEAQRAGFHELPAEFRGKIELGLAKEVHAGLALNESVAGVVFRSRAGALDFGHGLRGSDPAFYAWCTDLFRWHWERARHLSA